MSKLCEKPLQTIFIPWIDLFKLMCSFKRGDNLFAIAIPS